jgi:hypothetical protein
MKRATVIMGVGIVIVLLGIVALIGRSGLAFAEMHEFGSMHAPGMHAMARAGMGHGGPHAMGPERAGCPMATTTAATPEQREERAKSFVGHYIERFLPGYTLEKKTAN